MKVKHLMIDECSCCEEAKCNFFSDLGKVSSRNLLNTKENMV